jgi:hypothetical protein
MPVVSALCPLSLQTLFDIEGLPIRPARLYFFRATTVTPIVVYQDGLLSVAHQSPVLTNGNGRVPPIYVGSDPYRVRIFDSFGQLIEDLDNIAGAVVADTGGGGGGGTIEPGDPRLLTTGDMVAAFSQALRAGFVRCNGNTIGNASSGSSERANADCQALFEWMWGQDTDHMLPIIGGRGTSAVGDWNANKQITLPDLRARALFGIDGMGGAASGRLALATMDDAGTPAMLGGHGGRDRQTLDLTMVPAHSHGASGFSDSIGAHQHSVTTYPAGDHVHSVPQGGGGVAVGTGAAGTAATQAGQNTGAAGSHAHTGYTDTLGQHQHVLNISIANAGGGAAHQQVPPFFTSTVYIKL